jgi:hypothetical protein
MALVQNPDICAFIIVLGMILGFIVSKEGKILNPKKIQTIVNMPTYESPTKFKYSMGWHNFTDVL